MGRTWSELKEIKEAASFSETASKILNLPIDKLMIVVTYILIQHLCDYNKNCLKAEVLHLLNPLVRLQ